MSNTISEDMQINVHDIYPCEMLRMVSPRELVELLQSTLTHYKIEVKEEDFGYEDGRVDYVTFFADGNKIYYQDCGLFAGDEYFEFKKGCPKRIIDELLAVYAKESAGQRLESLPSKLQHLKSNSGLKICSPEELLISKGDSNLHKELLKGANDTIEKADKVLKNETSYFDDFLKNYKRRSTLGESIIRWGTRLMIIVNFVKEQKASKIQKYLLTEYFNWKVKTSGFEYWYDTFEEKIKQGYKGLSTRSERGGGTPSKDDRELISRLKQAIDNPKLIEETIVSGDRLYPQLKILLDKGE